MKGKKIKKSKNEGQSVMICPKCNSIKVFIDSSNPLVGFGVPPNYICENCGYTGKLFPEMKESDSENIEPNKLSKKESSGKIDVSYGKFLVIVWFKITCPLLLIVSIFLLYSAFNPLTCEIEQVEDTKTIPGSKIITYEKICVPDETKYFDEGKLIGSLICIAFSLLVIYIGYFRAKKIQTKEEKKEKK